LVISTTPGLSSFSFCVLSKTTSSFITASEVAILEATSVLDENIVHPYKRIIEVHIITNL